MSVQPHLDIPDDQPTFVNSLGKRIFCKYWEPTLDRETREPRALVFLSHGFFGHCQRFDNFESILTEKQYSVFSHDHVGHGLSEGARCVVKDFETYTLDVLQHVEIVRERYPLIPIFLIGYSMGGLITIHVALRLGPLIQGAIFLAPCLEVIGWTPFKNCLAHFLAPLCPGFHVKGKDYGPLSGTHDEEEARKRLEDPLMYKRGLKLRQAVQISRAIDQANANAHNLHTPYLLIQGDCDIVADYEASQSFHDKSASQDKTIIIVKGALHQLLHEIEPIRGKVINNILQWLKARE